MHSTEYWIYLSERAAKFIDRRLVGIGEATDSAAAEDAAAPEVAAAARREPWQSRWFGVLPLGVSMWLGGISARRRRVSDTAAPGGQA